MYCSHQDTETHAFPDIYQTDKSRHPQPWHVIKPEPSPNTTTPKLTWPPTSTTIDHYLQPAPRLISLPVRRAQPTHTVDGHNGSPPPPPHYPRPDPSRARVRPGPPSANSPFIQHTNHLPIIEATPRTNTPSSHHPQLVLPSLSL